MDQIDLTGVPLPGLPPFGQVGLILAKYLALGVIPMPIPTPLFEIKNPLKNWDMQEGTDYQHITKLASEVGYTFYVEPLGPGKSLAYWGPDLQGFTPGGSVKLDPNNPGLEVQPALTINMGSATNVETLSAGFDGLSKTFYYTYYMDKELTGFPIPIPLPDIALNPPLGPGYVVPAKNSLLGHGEGDKDRDSNARHGLPSLISRGLARASQSANVITGSGSLDVARYGRLLKARKLVAVRGMGAHYDGHYYVRSVTTTFRRGEARQSFALTRNAHGSWTEKVAI
jgi:hypothetical protein